MKIDWSKAPYWAYAYAQIIYKHKTDAKDFAWICRDGYRVGLQNDRREECWPFSKNTFEPDNFHIIEFRPALDPWTGEGLPPVGTVCEYKPYQLSGDWRQVEIIAHFRNKAMVAAFIPAGEGAKNVDQSIAECFRPIRTPEQIAAEERQRVIDDMRGNLGWDLSSEQAAQLYNAGYRKVPRA